MMKVLVLGASGMVGNGIFRYLHHKTQFQTYGLMRSDRQLSFFKTDARKNILVEREFIVEHKLTSIIKKILPKVVINCVGVIKQSPMAKNLEELISINSQFPHILNRICKQNNIELIHFSTDCVFSGKGGGYSEEDTADATDVYGLSKYLGELSDSNCTTIRTSFIGRELGSKLSLLDWFLSETGRVYGYKNAIFSGFPVHEIAHILNKYIIGSVEMRGLYHLAANPIDKYTLLKKIKLEYQTTQAILPFEEINLNRSLSASKFNQITGYEAPIWDKLLKDMHDFDRLTLNL